MTTAHHVNRIAPVNLHAPGRYEEMANGGESSSSGHAGDGAGFFTFTVGKLDAGMAILIGDRASQIEFPSLLLPPECTTGSVVRISVSRNQKEEQRKKRDFDELQQAVLDTFGRVGPKAPELTLRAVTQTSITLEWEKLQLATAKLLSLDILRNNERLAAIPNPMNNTSTKLSGLEVDKPYSFHLVLRTTAGTFQSNVIKTKTHTMGDTSGISVCFGFMDGSYIDQEGNYVDGELEAQAKEHLKTLGARWSDKIQIDTTHFVCTHPRTRANNVFAEGNPAGQMRGAMFSKAAQLSIPILLPHWIYACSEQRKLVPISHYYMDKEPPNAAKVRELIGKKPAPVAAEEQVSPTQEVAEASKADDTTPVAETSQAESIPPTPIPKSTVSDEAEGQVEGKEAETHPQTDYFEGPATTSIAIPTSSSGGDGGDEATNLAADNDVQQGAPVVPVAALDEGEEPSGTLPTSDSLLSEANLSLAVAGASEERLDEISLGGESVRGEATDEIDLS